MNLWAVLAVTCCLAVSYVLAQTVFNPTDLAVVEDAVSPDLACIRPDETFTVVWDELDAAGERVGDALYESGDDDGTGANYNFVTPITTPATHLDFTLRVTVTEATATLIRCTITPATGAATVGVIAIFNVQVGPNCGSTPPLGTPIQITTPVSLTGCQATITSGTFDDVEYDVISSWVENDVRLDGTRTIAAESTYTFPALDVSDANIYTCNIMISRPSVPLINPAASAVLVGPGQTCDEYTVNIIDDSIAFTMTYGSPITFDGDDEFSIGVRTGEDIACTANRHPVGGMTLRIDSRLESEPLWDEGTAGAPIDSDDIVRGTVYRCTNTAAAPEAEVSGELLITDALATVAALEIVGSNGAVRGPTIDTPITVGDDVTCRPAGDETADPVLTYSWIRTGGAAGPDSIVSGDTLEITENMGDGAEIVYSCTATSSEVVSITAPVTFTAVVPFVVGGTDAGAVFPLEDQARIAGEDILLPCLRAETDGLVVWQRFTDAGVAQLIYTSADTIDPINEYTLTNLDPQGNNDFTLRVEVGTQTSTLIRCTVSDPDDILVEVSATIAIFLVTDPITCSSSVDLTPEVNVASSIVFGACEAGVFSNTFDESEYDVIASWQEDDRVNVDEFETVSDTRSIVTSSEHTVIALTDIDTHRYHCNVQIARSPSELSTAATVVIVDYEAGVDGCPNFYEINIINNDVAFTITYGGAVIVFTGGDDFLSGRIIDNDLRCDAFRHPDIANRPRDLFMQVRLQDSNAWNQYTNTKTVLVEFEDIVVGSSYRCIYDDNNDDGLDRTSGIVTFVDSVDEVPTDSLRIYRQGSNEALTEQGIVDLFPGDYLECRLSVVVDPTPQFAWVKDSLDIDGPRLIMYDNEDSGNNRLILTEEMGGGLQIAYRCVADRLENLGVGLITDRSRLVTFQLIMNGCDQMKLSFALVFGAIAFFIIRQ